MVSGHCAPSTAEENPAVSPFEKLHVFSPMFCMINGVRFCALNPYLILSISLCTANRFAQILRRWIAEMVFVLLTNY